MLVMMSQHKKVTNLIWKNRNAVRDQILSRTEYELLVQSNFIHLFVTITQHKYLYSGLIIDGRGTRDPRWLILTAGKLCVG